MANQIFHGGIDAPALNELTRAKIAKLAALADAIEVDDGMVSFSGDIFAPEFITLGTWGDEDFTYTVDDLEHATITGFTDRGKAKCVLYRGAVTIPSRIGGHNVYYIAEDAFADNTDITSIHFDSSQIFEINARAFSGCTSLKSINLEVVGDIYADAFKWCTALAAINLSRALYVRSGCFSGCTSLSSVSIPGCRSIATAAFENTQSLKSIDLPDSLETLANDAFAGSGCVETVDGVKYVDTWAIGAADTTTTVTLRSGTVGIAESAFEGHTTLTSIENLDGVKHIGARAFANCASLVTIAIPDGMTDELKEYTFYGCTALSSVTIGSGVTRIGSYAFQGCTALTSITIPDTLGGNPLSPGTGDIMPFAFEGCTALASATLGNGVAMIGAHAFEGCTALESVVFGNNLQIIDYYAFRYCSALKNISFSPSINTIGGYAFQGCTGLESVLFSENQPSYPFSVHIGLFAFEGCTGLSSLRLPKRTSVDEQAFANCQTLLTVTVGGFGEDAEPLAQIGERAFYNCDTLKYLTIVGTQSIGARAFASCPALDTVTLSDNSVTTIGEYAFNPCASLTEITYNGTKNEFYDIDKGQGWADLAVVTIHCSDGDIA